jgi:hypothetical protein
MSSTDTGHFWNLRDQGNRRYDRPSGSGLDGLCHKSIEQTTNGNYIR